MAGTRCPFAPNLAGTGGAVVDDVAVAIVGGEGRAGTWARAGVVGVGVCGAEVVAGAAVGVVVGIIERDRDGGASLVAVVP